MSLAIGASLLLIIVFITLTHSIQTWNSSGPGYDIYCYGNCETMIETSFISGIMMMGGGTDVDDAFRWLIGNSGGGDIVVLRTSGTDAYNEYIYELGDVNSVTTIITHSRVGAESSEVAEIVKNAEALFVSGGDQSTYVNYWKDTPLFEAIEHCINKGITIGGTSAGLHIQGEYIYTGERGSAQSDASLKFPYYPLITLTTDFLDIPFLSNLITDSHFFQRDRMGRLITFLARLIQDGNAQPGIRGIGISEATALLVDRRGEAWPVGDGSIYILETTEKPKVCKHGSPLSIHSIIVNKLNKRNGGTINLNSWISNGGNEYSLNVTNGVIQSNQIGSIIY